MPFLIFILLSLSYAEDYHVGPSETYSTISDAIINVNEGDVLLIHHKSTPYYEKFVIPANNVHILGVPSDTNGDLPIIDASGATTVSGQSYTNGVRGLIKVGTANTPNIECPENVIIENLHVRNARPGYYFDGSNEYSKNAAGLYVECAKNLILRGNKVENNGNGIFIGMFYGDTSNITIEYNHIIDNGIDGSYYEHGSYCAAVGITYQFNKYGPMRAGTGGSVLKDRSVGTVIRYNWIQDGGRELDLVELQDLGGTETDAFLARDDYHRTFVYGNVIFESYDLGNRQMIHFGGDGTYEHYRLGPLLLYYNTIVSKRSGRTTLVRISHENGVVDARFNIVFADFADFEMLAEKRGHLTLTKNFLPPGYFDWVEALYDGSITYDQNIDGNSETPGFVDWNGENFKITNQSICSGASLETLHPEVTAEHIPKFNYVLHQEKVDRNDITDLGAFGVKTGIPPIVDDDDDDDDNDDNDDDNENNIGIALGITIPLGVLFCVLLIGIIVGVVIVVVVVRKKKEGEDMSKEMDKV